MTSAHCGQIKEKDSSAFSCDYFLHMLIDLLIPPCYLFIQYLSVKESRGNLNMG